MGCDIRFFLTLLVYNVLYADWVWTKCYMYFHCIELLEIIDILQVFHYQQLHLAIAMQRILSIKGHFWLLQLFSERDNSWPLQLQFSSGFLMYWIFTMDMIVVLKILAVTVVAGVRHTLLWCCCVSLCCVSLSGFQDWSPLKMSVLDCFVSEINEVWFSCIGGHREVQDWIHLCQRWPIFDLFVPEVTNIGFICVRDYQNSIQICQRLPWVQD